MRDPADLAAAAIYVAAIPAALAGLAAIVLTLLAQRGKP